MMKLFLELLSFCAILLVTKGLNIKTIKTISKATESLGLAMKVKDVITELMGGSSDTEHFDTEELVADISKLIDTAKTEILSSINLRSKLDRVDDALIVIRSSLVDIQNILEAQTGADELLEVFITHYEELEVIKHARFLGALLTYVSPGDSVDLITLIREHTRCSDRFMNDFRTFYLDLILDGALLEISYLTLVTQNVDIQSFVDKWADEVLEADKIFANQIQLCDARFPDDIQTDLGNYNDPAELKAVLDERYPDKIIDILFFSGIGTNQFLAFRHSNKERNFFWIRSLDEINKMLVTTTDGKPSWDKASTKSALEKCKRSITVDKKDSNLAADVLMQLTTCRGLAYPVGTVIVYFEGEKFETKAVTLHPDSPVVELSIEGVKIEYCFEFRCWFSWLPLKYFKDDSYGRLRIFIYPNLSDDVNYSDFVRGGSSRANSPAWLLIVAAIAALLFFQHW